jgi:hypothetical protein
VVHGSVSQGLESDISGRSPALDDDLGMDPLLNELFGFSEEFSSENCYGSGAVTYFFILSF